MFKHMFRLSALALSLSAAACTTGPSPVQVTRFHLNQPITQASVAITPARPADMDSLEFTTYANAIAAQLTQLGFTISADPKTAQQIAVVDILRGVRPSAAPARSPVSIGIGGGSYGSNVGIGIGTSFGLGQKKSNDVTLTTLSVQLRRVSDEAVLWEGRAVGEAIGKVSPADEIARLSTALFKGFPGQSGKTVEVK